MTHPARFVRAGEVQACASESDPDSDDVCGMQGLRRRTETGPVCEFGVAQGATIFALRPHGDILPPNSMAPRFLRAL